MRVAVFAVVCFLHLSGVTHGANPNYSYHVKIDDPAHINFQEKAETRKGEDAQGFYSVLEPNGALRTVSYIADERGFNPIVSYSYGHPQSSVTVTSAARPNAIVQKTGVYAPAYVADNRVQIVDKSNIYAAPPPALNLQTFALPGPSSPVIVPQPLRQVTPVVKASAAIAANYAPAYVPPPAAYLPPPQLAVAAPPPQIAVQQVIEQPAPVYGPPPALVQRVLARPVVQKVFAPPPAIALPVPQPQVFTIPEPPPAISYVEQPPPPVLVKRIRPAKYLTVPAAAPAVKLVKSVPAAAVAIVQDSYAEPPRDTFRDPNAPSYPDAVKVIKEPTADYGPPAYVPPPPLAEVVPAVKVRVVQPKVRVVQPVVKPYVQQVAVALPPPPPPPVFVQKIVAAPPPPPPQVSAVQKVAVAPPPVAVNPGLYAGAIGFHTVNANPDSYVHAYGTQGFQVTSSRKFNKAILTVPKQVVATPTAVYGPPAIQKIVQPAPVYGPPAIQQVIEPAPVYGPPLVQKIVQPRPVYGPPAIAVQSAPAYLPPAPAPIAVQPAPLYLPPPPVKAIATPVLQAAPLPLPQLPQFVRAPAPLPVPVPAVAPLPVSLPIQAALPPPPVLAAAPIQAAPVAVAAAPLKAIGASPAVGVSLTGGKQHPLVFAYSVDQPGAKSFHNYSGSGW